MAEFPVQTRNVPLREAAWPTPRYVVARVIYQTAWRSRAAPVRNEIKKDAAYRVARAKKNNDALCAPELNLEGIERIDGKTSRRSETNISIAVCHSSFALRPGGATR